MCLERGEAKLYRYKCDIGQRGPVIEAREAKPAAQVVISTMSASQAVDILSNCSRKARAIRIAAFTVCLLRIQQYQLRTAGLDSREGRWAPVGRTAPGRLFDPLGLEQTSLPATDDNAIPAPYSHGYMYDGSFYALADEEYPADMQAAARAGTLQPVDYTNQNSSYATAAGGAISTADNLATWMQALVSGKVFNADYHQQWIDSLQAEDPEPTWRL